MFLYIRLTDMGQRVYIKIEHSQHFVFDQDRLDIGIVQLI